MHRFKIPIITLVIILSPAVLPAQFGPGQYADEAPLRTWNTWGPVTAAYTGYGGSSYARAFDCSGAQINPGVLAKLPKFNLVMSGSLSYTQLFEYGPVNTGVLSSSGNLGISTYSYDFIGISYLFGSWGFSISQTRQEDYFRPEAEYTEYSEENAAYDIFFTQSGGLNKFNLSISRRIYSRLAVGLGLNMVSGRLEKNLSENYYYSGIRITDQKQHDISGYFINAGLVFDLTNKLAAGLVFRSAYTRKSKSESEYRIQAYSSGTDISIPAQGECSQKMPLVLGAGVNYTISPPLLLAFDVGFFNWADYNLEYFGEELPRNFKNIIKLNVGLEYTGSLVIFKHAVKIPLRLGAAYDPQPLREPNIKYTYISAGAGLRSRHFTLDLGAVFGRENGSGDDLRTYRLVLSMGYRI